MFQAPRARDLAQLLRSRAESEPRRVCHTWLREGRTPEHALTYEQLDRNASAIAARLLDEGAAGRTALLLYPPGLEFVSAFFGCLYAGVIAVPCPTATSRRDVSRIASVRRDCGASHVLTTGGESWLVERLGEVAGLPPARWIDTTAAPGDRAAHPRRFGARDVAYLQYTSGSTAEPKGVIVSHGNVLENLRYIESSGGFDAASVGMCWLPHFHDMGLVWGLLQPVFTNYPVFLFSAAVFARDPMVWLDGISRFRVTHSGGPNFAYDLCSARARSSPPTGLDLTTWRVAFNGAEPIRPDTLAAFTSAFAPHGFRPSAFYPVYGLAEATLKVTSADPDEGAALCAVGAATRVSCGRAQVPTDLAIVNPASLERCREQDEGEIWVAGPGVALGYWNNPDETERVFNARIAGTDDRVYLRTGDLGFVRGGSLYVTGRLKDCIIIRGQNYYPQDIEATLATAHEDLRPGGCVAVSLPGSAGEELAAICETRRRRKTGDAALIRAVRQAVVAHHGVDAQVVVLVPPGAVPKTSSGKTRRGETRNRLLSRRLDVLAASRWDQSGSGEPQLVSRILAGRDADERRSALHAYLRAQCARALHADPDTLDLALPWTAYALDSLAVVRLVHAAEQELGIRLAGASSVETGRDLAERVMEALEGRGAAPPARSVPVSAATPTPGCFPLSTGQRALWIQDQLSPGSTALNIARALRIRGGLDLDALRRAGRDVMALHPALRTHLRATRGGEVEQVVRETVVPPLSIVDASAWPDEELTRAVSEAANAPFDLTAGPLFRMHVFRAAGGDDVLALAVSHVVADLWSLAVLFEDFATAYVAFRDGRAVRLEQPEIDYQAHVEREQRALASSAADEAWAYWKRELDDLAPQPPLFGGHAGTDDGARRARLHRFHMAGGPWTRLVHFCRDERVTPFALLHAALAALLHRYSGSDDIAIGVPTHGRRDPELRRVVGYFVNPVVLRSRPASNVSFIALVRDSARRVLEAQRHATLPLPVIQERLAAGSGLRGLPFRLFFTVHSAETGSGTTLNDLAAGVPGAPFSCRGLDGTVAGIVPAMTQFDLTLAVTCGPDGLDGYIEYDERAASDEVVGRFAAHYVALVEAAVSRPESRLRDLPVLTHADRYRELEVWNGTRRTYGPFRGLAALLVEQAARTPDATALELDDVALTYRTLDGITTRLARHLAGLGAGPEVVVGVCAERSLEMVFALVAIVKAGGAWLALDPELPDDRLQYMTRRSGARLVLALDPLAVRLRRCLDVPTIALEPGCWTHESDAPLPRVTAANLAYVLFTSGSTGTPKGAANTCAGLVNRLLWMQERYGIGPGSAVLQKTPFSFDVSVWEFFWPLITGARLVVAPPGVHRDSRDLARAIVARRITHVHFVPSMLAPFLEEPASAACDGVLERVICSGEALTGDLVRRYYERLRASLENLYGPTEAAIDVTAWACAPDDCCAAVPIGRPIANLRAHVLDRDLNVLPAGQPGELYLGGIGVGRGYVHDAALTADRFVPDPVAGTPGARLYRTGDTARRRADGALEFLGRRDAQVKIRGVRVEPGEIESVLARHPAVRSCAVTLQQISPENQRLVAYVSRDEDTCSTEDLRQHARRFLPDYMVPALFVMLRDLPRLPNGKIDRRALPEPEGMEAPRDIAPPGTCVEEQLVAIWRHVLQRDDVGIHDDFFSLGGHSISALRLVSRMRAAFDVEIALRELFDRDATVAAVADLIETKILESADPAELAAVRAGMNSGDERGSTP